MNGTMTGGIGNKDHPWVLETPSRTSSFQAFGDLEVEPAILVCRTGATVVPYLLRCLGDLYWMLSRHHDWMALGVADERGRPSEGTVEAWARSAENPSADGMA